MPHASDDPILKDMFYHADFEFCFVVAFFYE